MGSRLPPAARAAPPRIAGRLAIALVAAFGAMPPAGAAMTDSQARRLAELSLEDLLQVEVTTVAGTAQTRMSAPAALTVISAEDIRRAGHRSLADALRMVPGMFVGSINSSSWVVGSRGLTASALTANRYLVLIDGRAVHDPLLSSTFWDTIDLVVEDIDRIEVIRGPGATLWGANAMNGVISVITRDARETAATTLRAGVGNYLRSFGALRHGAHTGSGAWRAWGKYVRRDAFENAQGGSIEDQWSALHGGFRADGASSSGLEYSVQGEAHRLPSAHYSIQEPIPGVHLQTRRIEGDADVDGGHLQLRIGRQRNDGHGWSLQSSYASTQREDARLGLDRSTYDIDFRSWTPWGENQAMVWGLQYGQTSDRIDSGASLVFRRPARTVETVNAFVQNTTELVDDRWFVMLGSKLSHHDFVGVQVQPSVRLWWTPNATQTFWAALSRPVRVPSRFEENGALIFSYVDTGLIRGLPASGVIVPLSLAGDEQLPVEKLLAWEAGHRVQIGSRWQLETSLFYNDYQRMISVPTGIFGQFNDDGTGLTYGGDIAASFQATPAWRLEGSYSLIRTEIDGPVLDFEESSTPQHLAQLRSMLDLGADWELNGAIYRVGEIPRLGIGAYERVDLGITWHATPQLDLALWGQNLTDPSHPEASGAEVPRSVYLQVSVNL
jgi:iron complex outermembrane receptor protein